MATLRDLKPLLDTGETAERLYNNVYETVEHAGGDCYTYQSSEMNPCTSIYGSLEQIDDLVRNPAPFWPLDGDRLAVSSLPSVWKLDEESAELDASWGIVRPATDEELAEYERQYGPTKEPTTKEMEATKRATRIIHLA